MASPCWCNRGARAARRVWIEFNNAQGLTAGKTHVSYKDVVVGTVSAVSLSKDRSGVVATVDFARDARDLLKDDTRFWIVRPQIGAAGISGIETLLSGVYIALDPGSTGEAQTHYKAMVDAPMVTRGSAGKRFLLKAADIGSLYVGAPIYFHHLKAGRLISYQMSPDRSLDVRIFIDAPYDRFVHPTTRFWNASGVDLSLSAAGLKVETQALATIVAGGIAFDDPPAAEVTPAAAADSTFYLTGDRTSAMADPDGPPLRMRMRFDSPLRGLAIGAPVEFYGVSIGNVVKVAVDFDPPTQKFSLLVDVVTYPHRLGSVLDKFPDQRRGGRQDRDVHRLDGACRPACPGAHGESSHRAVVYCAGLREIAARGHLRYLGASAHDPHGGRIGGQTSERYRGLRREARQVAPGLHR